MLTQEQIDAFRKALYRPHAEFDHPFCKIAREQEEAELQALLSGNYTLWLEIYRAGKDVYYPVPSLEDLRPMTEQFRNGDVLAVLNGCHPTDAFQWDEARAEMRDIRKPRREERHVHCLGEFDQYGVVAGVLMSVLLPRSDDAPKSFYQEFYEHTQALEADEEHKYDDYVTFTSEDGITISLTRRTYEELYANEDETDEEDGIDPIHRLN